MINIPYSIFLKKSTEKRLITKNPRETQKLGEILAKSILENKNLFPQKALILALKGDLGGGKTTFLKGFAKGLKIRSRITSPTFLIQKKFKINNSRFKNFFHIDCYRIKNWKEIIWLGFKEIANNPENIIAVEWPGNIKKLLPSQVILIEFNFIDEKKREIIFKNML